MTVCRAISLCLFASLLMPAAARAEVAVRIAPQTASLFIHEPFVLRLEVESDAPPEAPRIPAVPGLAVITTRRLPSEPARRKHAFEIGLIAQRDGILTVPPFAVQADGETVLTAALRLQIRTPRLATEMALAIAVEPTALRVGQPATVTVAWTSAVPFERCQQLLLEIPLLTDTRCQLFPLDPAVPEDQRVGVPVNDIRVFARRGVLPDGRRQLTFRYQLVPREPCVLRAQPARLICALLPGKPSTGQPPGYIYNQFFDAPQDSETYQRIYLAAPVAAITARALPDAGRTARYADIVGPCRLRTSLAPEHLVVGQPALFTVHLEGLAAARHITGLPSAAFDGLRPEFQLSAEPIRETATDHTRSFTRVLRPLHAGITRLPAVVIQIFNPDTGAYQTLRSAPIPITVEPAAEDASRAVTPRVDSQPPIPVKGIRHNRRSEQSMMPIHDLLEFLGRYWWAVVPWPPLAWLALLPLGRRWERCRRDPVYARAMAALWRFRRTAGRDEEAAWRQYLADRLALCAEALTADTVTEALRARRVDDKVVAEARRHFEEHDAAEYGRRPAASSPSTRSLVRRLHKATVPMALACCLVVSLRGSAAESPDELFARALQMRGEKPDEAQSLMVEAALRFESEARFLNAGNGWFFAGENGRALADYRAAQRRWPFDWQLHESVEFLRANRGDAFPPAATASGTVAAAWSRFCTWAAVLRIGLWVVAYLLAWMFFITAQLLGWRIRRTVWVVLIAALLVPLASVIQSSFQPAEGVVIEDAVARLGPGYAYDPAFQQPLHKATEFAWMETRQGWVRARLPDASEGWLRETDCMKVK